MHIYLLVDINPRVQMPSEAGGIGSLGAGVKLWASYCVYWEAKLYVAVWQSILPFKILCNQEQVQIIICFLGKVHFINKALLLSLEVSVHYWIVWESSLVPSLYSRSLQWEVYSNYLLCLVCILNSGVFYFSCRFSLGDARRPLHETAVLVEDVVHTQLINLVRSHRTIPIWYLFILLLLLFQYMLKIFLGVADLAEW